MALRSMVLAVVLLVAASVCSDSDTSEPPSDIVVTTEPAVGGDGWWLFGLDSISGSSWGIFARDLSGNFTIVWGGFDTSPTNLRAWILETYLAIPGELPLCLEAAGP